MQGICHVLLELFVQIARRTCVVGAQCIDSPTDWTEGTKIGIIGYTSDIGKGDWRIYIQ